MTIQVLGAGVGRTGTYSLKLALERLGLGPCYHMEEVLRQLSVHVPLWSAALNGRADWAEIYHGYASAVDWPTAGFFRELAAAYPGARFILTHRNAERWADSFDATIYKLIGDRDNAPSEMKAWLAMCHAVIAKTGFPGGLSRRELIARFVAHNETVKQTIPADRLLVYEVKDGWEPLCRFLDLPVPRDDFPCSNGRAEFWDRVSSGM